MKKIFLSLFFMTFIGIMSYAQRADVEVVEIDKHQIAGYTVSFHDYSVDEIAAALSNRFEKKEGFKSTKFKGYTAYFAQPFSLFGQGNYDIYTKAEAVGKKENLVTKAYIVVTTGNYNSIDEATSAKVMAFIESFIRYAIIESNDARILKLNEDLKKEQKEIEKLTNEKSKLENKLKETADSLIKSQTKAEELQKAIDKIKAIIQNL